MNQRENLTVDGVTIMEDKSREEIIQEIIQDVLREFEDREKRWESGYKTIDRITGGFYPGELTLIAGRPSAGKTAFTINLARNMAILNGYSTVYVELEMRGKHIVERLISLETQIGIQKIRNGQLTDEEMERIQLAQVTIGESKLFIDDNPESTVSEVKNRSESVKNKRGLDIVIVDCVQLLRPFKHEERRYMEYPDLLISLKRLAAELNVHVVVVWQLPVSSRMVGSEPLTLRDFRDMGVPEQFPDIIMVLNRDIDNQSEKEEIAEISILKNRHGPLGTIRLLWDPECLSFRDAP